MNKDNERAKEQAQAQLCSINEMVFRLIHAGECLGDEDCELSDQEIAAGLNILYQDTTKITEEDREEYHDEDLALEAIREDPLSIQVRSNWESPGGELKPAEYEILLCTGGPAVRIIGELSKYNEPENAEIQYQDWFTGWETLPTSSEDEDDLLVYSSSFWFGE